MGTASLVTVTAGCLLLNRSVTSLEGVRCAPHLLGTCTACGVSPLHPALRYGSCLAQEVSKCGQGLLPSLQEWCAVTQKQQPFAFVTAVVWSAAQADLITVICR